MDEAGNIVVAYNASGAGLNPSLRYTSREAGDAPGTLPGGEVDCVAGGGVQTSSFNRWGDYSAISVDPVNACTFWLTGEYYANTGNFDFKTRICRVTLTTCGTSSNTPPLVTITAPANGSSHAAGSSITFTGTANDAEDGNLAASLTWTSNRDGVIGSGASFGTTALSVGTHQVTASVTDSQGLPGSAAINITVTSGGGTTEVTFTSIGADDGLLLESSETSNTAGLVDSSSSGPLALRIGDLSGDPQMKTLLSFDTSSIPDGSTVVSATVRVRRGGLRGTSPYVTHGAALVDVRQGWFGSSPALEQVDFAAAPTAAGAGTLSNPAADGDWAEAMLNATGLAAVNRGGLTQLRLAFALDDDDDNVSDWVSFRSGDDSDAASRPRLIVRYSDGGGGNTPPMVSISGPANGSTFPEGTSITFSGSASDAEDGSLTAGLAWTSNLSGAIGTGGSFQRVLAPGQHTVTASVVDSGGLPGSASITVTVVANALPIVTITSPANGSTFVQGTSIAFAGTATDAEDGILTAGLAWTSNLSGAIGTGGSFQHVLPLGVHTVTASVTDSGGQTGSASITVTVVANTPPIVTITSPANGSTFVQGASIAFAGTATDGQDGNLTSGLTWTSNLDGSIGAGGSFSAVLSLGTHTVTASVNDSGGLPGAAGISVTVNPPGGTTEVTFTSTGAQDGWVAELVETMNQGGITDASVLRLGDLSGDQQLKTILSFDTSSIPDGATIVSVTLRVRRIDLRGSNPFLSHGTALVDVRAGAFSGNAALEPGDFEAAPTATGVVALSNAVADGDWSQGALNGAGLAAVNRTGLTQLRLYFSLEDDDDATSDFLTYRSGEDADAASRPQLIVVYQQ
jgi:hypothetical protein